VHACVRVCACVSVPPEYSFQTVTKYNLPAWLAPLTLLIETISSSTLFSIRSICSETKTSSSLSKAVAESVSSPAKTSAPVASSTTKLLFYSGYQTYITSFTDTWPNVWRTLYINTYLPKQKNKTVQSNPGRGHIARAEQIFICKSTQPVGSTADIQCNRQHQQKWPSFYCDLKGVWYMSPKVPFP